MITSFSEAAEREFDICIAGTGPAGMILALEFSRNYPSLSVALLEFGRPDEGPRNNLDDTIRNQNPVNHHEPYECTNKALGGTSGTWGGRCVMYDDADFEDRAVVNGGCTWNAGLFKEVKEFVPLACRYFECGDGPFNTGEMPALRGRRIADHFVEGDVTDSVVERWSMPTRFGTRYAAELETSPSIFLLQGVECRRLPAPGADGRVAMVEVRCRATNKVGWVRAALFVLAAGTQETTRILLRSKELFERLGGPPASLGRYYQGHVSGKIASVRFYGNPRSTDYGFHRDPDGSYFRRRFQLPAEVLSRENLLNTALWLDNPLYFDPAHGSGAMSVMYLAMVTPVLGKKLAPPAIAHSVTKGKVTGVHRHLWNILKGLPGSIVTPGMVFFRRYCLKRKLPGVFIYSPQNRYALHFHAEQLPNADNRMELGPDGETLTCQSGC